VKILVLSPHTDDAELGCGGSVIRWLEEGHTVHWIAFSSCEESIPATFEKDATRREFENNMKFLGVNYFKLLDYPVRKFDQKRQDILEYLVKMKHTFDPDLVVGTSINDTHQDHQVIASEMVRCFRNCANVISYELPYSELRFEPRMFIKLKKRHIDNKCILIDNYESQKQKNTHQFSCDFIYSLANIAGLKSREPYAEAFEVIRWIM
jgi:LmbE family N-acetylglucosaminyl deacetylase